MRRNRILIGLSVFAAAGMLCTASPAFGLPSDAAATKDISSTMTWDAMRIGGGGFVSGIVTGKKVMYARTDVGGAYKYNYTTEAWEQLFGFLNDAERGYLSVDAMAVDPSDDDTVYFLCGCAYFSDAGTRIYKTTDGGKTFTYADVTELIQVHGNGDGRQFGEAIAVDPDNPKVIYAGGDVADQSTGLIKSTDGGKTWKSVEGYGKFGYFSETVKWPTWTEHTAKALIDAEYNHQNGVSAISILGGKVYVATSVASADSVIVADTSKDTFTALSGLPANFYPSRINQDANGDLLISYMAGIAFAGSSGAAYRYDPSTGKATQIFDICGLGSVWADPENPDHLVAGSCGNWQDQEWAEWTDDHGAVWGDQYYRSFDGGETWQNFTPGHTSGWNQPLVAAYLQDGGYDWIREKAIHWSGTVVTDPCDHDRMWITSGNGIFVCTNVWSTDDASVENGKLPTYTFHPDGIEEVVSLDFTSTADGLDLSAIGDYDGFVHNAVNEIGLQYNPNMGSTSAIAVCPQDTDVWVRIAAGDTNNTGSAFYTKDRGKTWNVMKPAATGGKAAIAKIDSKTYRIFNTRTGGASYSDDFGETWNAISLPGLFYNMQPGVFPDPEDPSIVWAYGYSKAANQYDTTPTEYKLYKSTDGGKTFADPISVCTYDQCDPATRIAYLGGGDLVLGGGWYGLYSVSGKTSEITKLDVFYCKTVGYGAPEKKGGVNTLYMYGKITEDDTEGIYRSTDGGKTWVCINTEHLYGGTGNGNYLVGDMNEFGKVYMSTVGCGIICGWLDDGTTPPAVTTTKSDDYVLWGDVNDDGDIDLKDAVLLARAASGVAGTTLTTQGRKNAAVTGSAELSGADTAKLLRYLASILTYEQLAP